MTQWVINSSLMMNNISLRWSQKAVQTQHTQEALQSTQWKLISWMSNCPFWPAIGWNGGCTGIMLYTFSLSHCSIFKSEDIWLEFKFQFMLNGAFSVLSFLATGKGVPWLSVESVSQFFFFFNMVRILGLSTWEKSSMARKSMKRMLQSDGQAAIRMAVKTCVRLFKLNFNRLCCDTLAALTFRVKSK